MKSKIIVVIFGVCLVVGCRSEQKKDQNADGETVKLTLNNGVKWTLSPEMVPYLEKSFDLIDLNNSIEDKDYTSLANELNLLKGQFVSKCKMKGKSHEVLHAWLIPYMALLDQLKHSTNEEQSAQIFKEIVLSMNTFKVYFKLNE